MEVDCVNGGVEDSYCKSFNSCHHQILRVEAVHPPLVEGQFLQVTGHARPQLVHHGLPLDASCPFVEVPL